MVTPDGVTSLKGAGAMPLYIYQAPSKGERRSEGQHVAHLELSFARFDRIDNLIDVRLVRPFGRAGQRHVLWTLHASSNLPVRCRRQIKQHFALLSVLNVRLELGKRLVNRCCAGVESGRIVVA
jgi:hypothetical protein